MLGERGAHENLNSTITGEGTDHKRAMAYTNAFKTFVHEHPHVLRQVETQIDELYAQNPKPGDELSTPECKVVFLDREPLHDSDYFSVHVAGRDFFVKAPGVNEDTTPAYAEVVAGHALQKKLEGLHIPKLKVVKYHFGYTDSKGRNILVADLAAKHWRIAQEYMNEISKTDLAKADSLQRRTDYVMQVLDLTEGEGEFLDIQPYNMFYDPDTDELILFDISYPDSLGDYAH